MRSAGRRLLIVEDDPVFADVLVEVCRRLEIEPMVAPRGDEGIAMARHVGPSAVALDLTTPGMDGWIVLDRLRHDPATRGVPVCVVTGDDRRERALRLGAFAFLQKPTRLEILSDCLVRAVTFAARDHRRVGLLRVEDRLRARLDAAFVGASVRFVAAQDASSLQVDGLDAIVVGSPAPPTTVVDVVESLGPRLGPDLPLLVAEDDGPPTDRHLQAAAYPAFAQRVPDDRLATELAERLHLGGGRPRGSDGRLRGRRVLLVDDDPRNLMATVALLEAEGSQVHTASSADDALRRLREGDLPDIILTDIMMPGMDGHQLMRTIRTMPRLRTTPILALTAKAMRGDRERCIAAGATDYVPKPVDPDQLLSTMRVALTA